jgi:DNA invertase Pin-like site-specific DNA recombinase
MYRIAYLRVSTDRQKDSGAGLAAQRRAIEAEATRRGWSGESLLYVEDVLSGKTAKRPQLDRARAMLASGEASTLIVAKMDRLSRSLLDFASIMADSQSQGWTLIALDAPCDPSTPQGEMMATMLAAFAQLERRLISERTKAALAEKRAEGVKLGRPRVIEGEVREWIVTARARKRTYQSIADELNATGVATAHGGSEWRPSSVRAVVTS